MQLRKTLLLYSFAACWLSAAHSAFATGFALPDQDAFAVGRGMAFVATADNPSAIFYNPAGISQLEGNNVRFGAYAIHMDAGFVPPQGGPKYHSDKHNHLVPQFFYTWSPENSDLSLGLGLFSPFGLSSRWPQETGFRTVATEGSLRSYNINPVVSWQVAENVSVAAGAVVNYAEVDLRQGLIWPSQDLDLFKFKGDGWSAGYNLGLLWRVHEKVSLGANFRSTTEVNMKGYTEYYNSFPFSYGPFNVPAFPPQQVGADTDFRFPLKAVLGISYRPTPQWNLEFNADYTAWNQLDALAIRQQRGLGALIPQQVNLPLYWDASWYYEFGVTRYFANGWHVSFGYIYNENSVPDANYTPLVADLDRHFVSAGIGFHRKQWTADLAYEFGYGPNHSVAGSRYSAAFQTADGTYDFISHAVALSVGLRF